MKQSILAVLIPAFIVMLTTAFYTGKHSSTKATSGSTELIVNMTSDATEDAHGTLMGLHFAMMAMENGLTVTVFLNVDGVKLLLPESKGITFDGENVYDLLMAINNSEGMVIACPHCMQINGVTQDMLPDGIVVSNPKLMSGKLKGNPTVFTY